MEEHSEHARHSTALRARAPCESTPWRPGCHRPPAGAQWGKERLPCLLPMQDTAGRTPSLLAFTPEQCPSWPRRRVALSPDVTTWGVRSNPHHPLGSLGPSNPHPTARIYSARAAGKRTGLYPLPLVSTWSRGAAPTNSGEPPSLACTSVKPELFRPGRKNLGWFFLFGKLDAFYSSLGRILRLFLHPWLIGVQSAGDEFYQTTESPSRTETFRVFCASCEERRKMLVTVRKA